MLGSSCKTSSTSTVTHASIGDTQGARGAVSNRPHDGDDGGAVRKRVDGDGGGSANTMSDNSDQVEMGDDGAVVTGVG